MLVSKSIILWVTRATMQFRSREITSRSDKGTGWGKGMDACEKALLWTSHKILRVSRYPCDYGRLKTITFPEHSPPGWQCSLRPHRPSAPELGRSRWSRCCQGSRMHHRAGHGNESSGVSQGRERPEPAHPGQAGEETTRLSPSITNHHRQHQVTDRHSLPSWPRNHSVLTPFPVKQWL